MFYDVAAQLNRIVLQPLGQPETVLFRASRYNATGLPESQTYGNGIIDTAVYDPATGRAVELKTQAATGNIHQHLPPFDPRCKKIEPENDAHWLVGIVLAHPLVAIGNMLWFAPDYYRFAPACCRLPVRCA